MNVAKRDQAETELLQLSDILRQVFARLTNPGPGAMPVELASEIVLMVTVQALGIEGATSVD